MNLNWQKLIESVAEVSRNHPLVNSVDDGREMEFDTRKSEAWPRVFLSPATSNITGGQGSVVVTASFTIVVADRLVTDRSNMNQALGDCHSIMLDIFATLNKYQVGYITQNPLLTPVQDYQDSQSAGWTATFRGNVSRPLNCFEVPELE